jgi:PPOX class probable F420-dependent enzyme
MKLPAWAEAMLAEGRVARLGMVDDELGPRVLPVTYVFHAGGLYTAVDEKPKRARGEELARVRFLRRRPRAALTVDHYEEDWSALAWVQALGRVQVLAAGGDPAAVAALVDKYPQYRAEPPPGPLLKLAPERFLYWRAGA